jgi:DNA-binding MarR family transcriptional regulator
MVMLADVRPRPSDDRPAPLLRLLGLTTQLLADDLHRRLHAAGIDDQGRADDAAMAHIPPEGIRLTGLAERAGVTKQAMAELVDSLVARGYVERTADPTDGRAKLIVFSERGWAAVDAALDALADIEADLVAELGDRRIQALRRTLELVIERRAGVT